MAENMMDEKPQQRENSEIFQRITKLLQAKETEQTQITHVLETTIESLEKVTQILEHPSTFLTEKNPIIPLETLPPFANVGCQGVAGAYSHIACEKAFDRPDIHFYQKFEDVTTAVVAGQVEFGVLPIENSTAGNVEEVIDLVCSAGCYIHTMIQIPIAHCLCGRQGASISTLKRVHSHPQALRQSAGYLKSHGFTPVPQLNTAIAGKMVAEGTSLEDGCICSRLSAELYGLEILQERIQDQQENYTRFICISKKAYVLPDAEYVSVALSFPNELGALGRLLTGFSALNLDLTKIQSMPIGGEDFNVRFHLDFKGRIADGKVENLLGHMYESYEDFQFLGNYRAISHH